MPNTTKAAAGGRQPEGVTTTSMTLSANSSDEKREKYMPAFSQGTTGSARPSAAGEGHLARFLNCLYYEVWERNSVYTFIQS